MSYVDEVLEVVKVKDASEPEFIQTATEILDSLRPLIDANEETYRKVALLERLVEPEKIVTFRIPWEDDAGHIHVNRGWKIQFSSAIGPYKGGIRFSPSVDLGTLKFLSFEQMFKNSLTGLPIGGGKGGADFDPQGKSDTELMRFCQSFMTNLYHYIGANMDCPAGDLGCGTKELGYMFGQYKRLINTYESGVLSGKPIASGGIVGRDTATGYGALYFTEELLKDLGETVEGKTFALSGFGNVAWGCAKKIADMGGKVVTISGPDGYVYDPDGISGDKLDYMLEMRDSRRNRAQDYADKYSVSFFPKAKPWGHIKADIYMPCAVQNDIHLEDAKRIVREGTCKVLVEVANMPTTPNAISYLREQGIIIAPYKAVNCGGVAVSAMEMAQNAEKLCWSAEDVDNKLHPIMKNVYKNVNEAAAKYGKPGDLIAGANLAAAEKIFAAMVEQGVC